MTIYDYSVNTIDGKNVSLENYKGKVLLIVNTASKCGFTPQYEDLQKIYSKYKDKGFEILGFPSNQFAEQEPGSNEEIKNFCYVNFGVDFPLFEKIDVRGDNADPLFKYLTENTSFKGFDENNPAERILSTFLKENFPDYLEGNSIKWNFTKFLIDKDGKIVNRFESPISPLDIAKDINHLISKN